MGGENVTAAASKRTDIQGLRGLSALIVIVYHVWTERTAGAVDVFFVVSGYLLFASLLRQHAATGSADLLRYGAGILRRLMPAAVVMLLLTVVISAAFLPQSRWRESISDGYAFSLFIENRALAARGVDYLARDSVPTPFANAWAISTQAQAYVMMAVLMVGVILLGRLLRRRRLSQFLIIGGATVFSFGWAIFTVGVNPVAAYFSTNARLWEFTAGGLMAIVVTMHAASERWRDALSWLGLTMLLSTGPLFGLTGQFPAWASLWPVAGALLIMWCGADGAVRGAGRLLAWRPLQMLGDVSYGVYLYHGALLTFALLAFETPRLDLTQGFGLTAATIGLASFSKYVLERPLRRLLEGASHGVCFLYAAALVLVCTGAVALWGQYERLQSSKAWQALAYAEQLPGGMADPDAPISPRKPILPAPIIASRDVGDVYADGCHVAQGVTEARACLYGPADAGVTIALVGGSHVAHWTPAFQALGRRQGWRIMSMTKSSCPFWGRAWSSEGKAWPECGVWNAAALRRLLAEKPDIVVSLANFEALPEERLRIAPETLALWRTLGEAGIQVLALRDTSGLSINGPECVELYGADDARCEASRPRGELSPAPTSWPQNVTYVDPADWVCGPTACPAVIGNVMVFFDKDHFTATFSRSLAPRLEPVVKDALARQAP